MERLEDEYGVYERYLFDLFDACILIYSRRSLFN